jgi:hypothetical protein
VPNFRIIDNENFTFDLFGSNVLLTRNSGTWCITGPAFPSPIALDASEANAALQIGQRSSTPELLTIGLDPQHDEPSLEAKSLRAQVGNADSVLLDTTTFASAALALEEGPKAAPLLDLSTVTNAFVLYEQIIIQRSILCEIPSTLKSALKMLHCDRSTMTGTLWSTNVLAANAATDQQPNPMTDAWRAFLGRDDIRLDSRAWNEEQDSPGIWDGVPASYYIDYHQAPSITTVPSTPGELKSLNDFLSIQTIRTLFNDRVASMLGVPYVAASMRSPVHALLLSQKIKTQHLADRLLSQIGPPTLEAPSTTAYVNELSVPFLLGIAFTRMKTPSDYWAVVQELRDSFAPLRARIAADREEWQGRSGVYLSEYLKHLKDYMPPGLRIAQEAATGTSALAAAVSPVGGGLVDLAVKMACALKTTEKAYHWYLKHFKPHIYVVVEMATEAKSLRAVENEVERLWSSQWTRRDHDQLERLSVSRPEVFSRLRKLDVAG